jgi:hypothetical protein
VVGGVEAYRCQIAERANMLAVVRCAQGITAILYEIELVLPGDGRHGIEIEGVTQSVRDDDRPGFRSDRRCQALDIDVGRFEIDVDKHRNAAILDDRRNGGGEARSDGDDLAARLNLPLVKLPGRQCREGQKVGGRPGYCHAGVLQAKSRGERFLELSAITTDRQPHIQ